MTSHNSIPSEAAWRWPVYAIEGALLGAFMVSACAFTVLLEHPASPLQRAIPSELLRRFLIGLAMGATAVGLIYSPWGRRSGAHMNPAFTFCFLWLKRIQPRDALGYIVGQFAGGIAGILLCLAIAPTLVRHPTVEYVVTTPGRYGILAAWAGEFGISFLLMSVVLAINALPCLAKRTGYIAGVLITLYVTFEAPLSGMSINPARTLGSAVPAGIFTGLWIYFTAPVLGMLAAVEVHALLGRPRHLICGRLNHCHKTPSLFHCNCAVHADINKGKESQCKPQTILT